MKYMGSKRWMLQNGLGTLLRSECAEAKRFVDLFAGSGAVASFVARETALPVVASDLQHFSVILTRAIIGRETELDGEGLWCEWLESAQKVFYKAPIPQIGNAFRAEVEALRAWSQNRTGQPFTQAYGGHYYSPQQAMWIDALRRSLPSGTHKRSVALAALVVAASSCAASPGHTAQPFQPTRTARKFLKVAWSREISSCVQQALKAIAPLHAQRKGRAFVADANLAAKKLEAGDLVFLDPPYSGVQYSRFYHVLEAIVKGRPGPVSGTGRYPPKSLRPQSNYSVKTYSQEALRSLLQSVANAGARAILTFPAHECSNGLSGDYVQKTAAEYFRVKTRTVESKFSTLGGNSRLAESGKGRQARQKAQELILSLVPLRNSIGALDNV